MKSLAERQAMRYFNKCVALKVESLDLTNERNLAGIGGINLHELPFDLSEGALIPTEIRAKLAGNGGG